MVKVLAPGLKTISLTFVGADSVTLVLFDEPKVAVSAAPFGTVAGDQSFTLFQSFVLGFVFQVALPANAVFDCVTSSTKITAPRMMLRPPPLSSNGGCFVNDVSK